MPSAFFGQYLLEKGVISKGAFLQAIERQKTISQPMCALAISKGHPGEEQLKKLDETLARSGFASMEAALKTLVSDPGRWTELQRGHVRRGLYLAEALLRDGALSPSLFAQAFADYCRECPDSAVITSPVPPDAAVPHRDIVEAVATVLINVFVHYTRQVVRVAGVADRVPACDASHGLFRQRVVGDTEFELLLVFTEPLMLALASSMFGERVDAVGPAAVDALCEFLNVVSGGACAKMGEEGRSLRAAGPPEKMAADLPGRTGNGETAVLDLETTAAAFQCIVFFPGKNIP